MDPAQLRVTMRFFTQAAAPFSRAEGITGYAVGTSGLLLYGLGSGGRKIGGGEEAVLRTTSGEAVQHASWRATNGLSDVHPTPSFDAPNTEAP